MKTYDRRYFIYSAASLAAMPLVPNSIVRAASEADPRLIFKAVMDDVNSFSEYGDSDSLSINRLHSSGNSPVISNARSRAGNKSLRVLLNRESSSVSYRTEVSSEKNKLKFFKTHWIGFSIYVPADWAISNTWEVIWQLHNHPLSWDPPIMDFSPILGIRIEQNTDQWKIVQDYAQTPEEQQKSSDLRSAFSGLYGTIARGAWTDFVIEYRPDWRDLTDGGTGVTRIWRNGDQIVDYRGPNAVNETNSPYIKFGIYKSAWKDRNHNDPLIERLYYFDEFRVSGPDLGSYDLVAPGRNQGDPARPKPPELLSTN